MAAVGMLHDLAVFLTVDAVMLLCLTLIYLKATSRLLPFDHIRNAKKPQT